MNILYKVKRMFSDIDKIAFSINNNTDPNNLLTNIILKLHSNDKKLVTITYDNSFLIEGLDKKHNILFSIFLNFTNKFVYEIVVVSHYSFNIELIVNQVLEVFNIRNNENLKDLEKEILLSNDEREVEISYKRECISGLYHDFYTLTTLLKG